MSVRNGEKLRQICSKIWVLIQIKKQHRKGENQMILINNDAQHVKFVSYTGKYPNLCSGVLTLEIDGNTYRFGHDYNVYESWKTDGNYDSSWESSGRCGFTNHYEDSFVEHGTWVIDVSDLPEELRQYASEIDKVFNDNVPEGCCGGCL